MTVAGLLGVEGPLAREVPGFAPRAEQQAMAEAIQQALADHHHLVVEAGTGTGKTFAYLVPALASKRRVIVSTGTRALQDQLFHKDLPVVRDALARPVQTALLKGRANYLCRYRLESTLATGQLGDRRQVSDLARVQQWAGHTRHGDIAEVAEVPEDSPLWYRVTSTAENCLGQDCRFFQDCFVLKARRRAMEAELLVINHHLLLADMVVREEGFGEILPGADLLILDEAHQLPEIAGQFFGTSLSSRQLLELARDSRVEQGRDAADFPALAERALRLENALPVLRLALGAGNRRAPWAEVENQPAVTAAMDALCQALEELLAALAEAAPRGKGLASCAERAELLQQRLQTLLAADSDSQVRWFETYPQRFVLSLTPLDVAPVFQEQLRRHQGTWVFTSATLAVAGDFSHFIQRLGLESPATLQLPSPFDYARNALLYHPTGLPDPASPHYTAALVEAVLPVLAASGGRAFLLFTSHRALREAAELLDGRIEYPLLVQGERSKQQLLAEFRELGNAVLLGTSSFWEGVDVRGETLSLVVISKLPFASPGDPVLQARIQALRQRGENPFVDHQLPLAVLNLKQGVGRLIRDVHDRGVLMLCDPRLLGKSYGRLFLDSLPPMKRTRKLARVQQFFAATGAPLA